MTPEHTETTLGQAPETEKQEGPQLLEPHLEADGTFSVLFPSAVSADQEGHLLGVTPRVFATRQEAIEVAAGVRDYMEQHFDLLSLQKTLGEELPVIPTDSGFVVIERDVRGGRRARVYDTWEQARDAFIETQPDRPPDERLFELEPAEGFAVILSELDNFAPEAAPTREQYDAPPELRRYIGKREMWLQSSDGETYQHTIAEKGWERKLFRFIEDYTKQEGQHLLEELGIERLDALSPEQAVQLATMLTMELHKYDHAASNGNDNPADKATALELLQSGRFHKENQSWEGNGVCRNVASTVKAVFEALKANQTRLSRLTNTYAVVETGIDDFVPQHRSIKKHLRGGGHAWNSFITISRGGEISGTIVDATWGKSNLDTHNEIGADYTNARMEKLVYVLARGIDADTPNREKQIRDVLNFYADRIDSPPDLPQDADRSSAQHYFAERALSLIDHLQCQDFASTEVIEQIVVGLTAAEGELDTRTLKRVWGLGSRCSEEQRNSLLRSYVAKEQIGFLQRGGLVFADAGLQREALVLFARERGAKNFQHILNESPEVRFRARDVLPGILPEFDPRHLQPDRRELRFLASRSQRLQDLVMGFDEYSDGTSEKPQKFMDRADALLREILGEEAASEVFAAHPTQYERIANFDRLTKTSTRPRWRWHE
jgi:hypothetical protein